MTMDPPGPHGVKDAYCLLNVGDSITTDHISPAGSINKDSPAAKFLLERGVAQMDFNSYGSRRGNDEVMARGTFANIRIVNKLLNGEVGPKTVHIPTGEKLYVFDAAMIFLVAAGFFYPSLREKSRVLREKGEDDDDSPPTKKLRGCLGHEHSVSDNQYKSLCPRLEKLGGDVSNLLGDFCILKAAIEDLRGHFCKIQLMMCAFLTTKPILVHAEAEAAVAASE